MNRKDPSLDTDALVKDPEFKRSVKELTEAVVENLQEMMLEDLEPYEAYANHIRHQVHQNLDKFRDRFTSGYQALLDEMKEEQ